MKITSREQLQKHLPWLGPDAWDLIQDRVTLIQPNGDEFTISKEPEPVVMYTGEEYRDLWRKHRGSCGNDVRAWEVLSALTVVRQREIDAQLPAQESLQMHMSARDGLPMDHELFVKVLETLSSCGRDSDIDAVVLSIFSLITEHIEANRPELTDAVVSKLVTEWADMEMCQQNKHAGYGSFLAHRAAEYRSPAVAELRAENERLHAQCERLVSETYVEGDLVTRRDDALLRMSDENLELRKENERLMSELASWRTEHACCGSVDELHKKQAKINELSDRMQAMVVSYDQHIKQLTESLKLSRSPQPVDDSDEYGILVQDGCVALMKRNQEWIWGAYETLSKGNQLDHFETSNIFKVTSQPPAPEDDPPPEDSSEYYVTHNPYLPGWAVKVKSPDLFGPKITASSAEKADADRIRDALNRQPRGPLKVPSTDDIHGEREGLKFNEGAEWAIEWIQKANGELKLPSEEEIEGWAQRYALPEQTHVRAGCRSGAREAIKWIEKANGAE